MIHLVNKLFPPGCTAFIIPSGFDVLEVVLSIQGKQLPKEVMKLLIIMFSFFSVSAFAYFNEVECEGRSESKEFTLDVEQPFPYGSVFRRAQLTVTEDGAESGEDYTVSIQAMRGFPRVRYYGAGLRLEVDFWPDQAPRWGRVYSGSLYSSLLDGEVRNLQCRFPNAY